MTEASTTTTGIDGAFVPKGRPVARFVAAIAVASGVLTVLWWSALCNPRVDISIRRSDASAARGNAVLSVRNAGPTAVRVQVVDVNDRFVRLTAPSPIVAVGPRHTERVTVQYVVDCAAYHAAEKTPRGATTPALRLRVRTRAPLGLTAPSQWPHGDELGFGAACGEATD
jgi:hypothetical protein